MTVRVPVSDDQGVTGVTAALRPARRAGRWPSRGGAPGWEGRLEVAALPFPDYARTVTVRVMARDAAGNEGAGAGSVTVTRALWAAPDRRAGSPPRRWRGTAGRCVGVDREERQLVKVTPEGEVAWEVTVGTMGIVGAPAVGEGRVFVGSLDGKAYTCAEESLRNADRSACM